jgi:drug/metabolite transporter (DMT)-like permease
MPSTDDRAEQHDNRNGLTRVALAGVIWGTIPLVIRAADGASLIKVFYRVAFAAVAVIIVMAIRGRLSEITGLRGAKLRQVAGQAVILTLNWAFFLTALDLVDVATVELLAYTGPVFVTVLAPFVTGEPTRAGAARPRSWRRRRDPGATRRGRH